MSTTGYQRLPEGSEDVDGMKQNQIKKIIAAYRGTGQTLFLKKHPEIVQEIQRRAALKFKNAPISPINN